MHLRITRVSLISIGLVMFLPASLIAQTRTHHTDKTTSSSRVPFVGCPEDGQLGPHLAPKESAPELPIPAAAAQRLAYYRAEHGPGVLAPRGWHGFGTYGSNGASIFVTPQPIKPDDLFSDKWHGFTGPAIQASLTEGGTSGRFEIARFIARLFPKQKDFVQTVIDEKIEPASAFPYGPFPKDQLKYCGANVVEYHTPPNAEGLGTQSRLRRNKNAIDGVVILLDGGEHMSRLAVRLPPDSRDLKSIIIQQFEEKNAED